MGVYLRVITFPIQLYNGSPYLAYPQGLPGTRTALRSLRRQAFLADASNVPKEWKQIIQEANDCLCRAYRMDGGITLVKWVLGNPLELEFRSFKERSEFLSYVQDRLSCFFPFDQVQAEFCVVLQNTL